MVLNLIPPLDVFLDWLNMKISIIGGGPAGLYCANALKLSNPHFDITIYEARNDINWLENIDTHIKNTNTCELIDHYLQKNNYKRQSYD